MLFSCLKAFSKIVVLCLATGFCLEVFLPTPPEKRIQAKYIDIRLITEAVICRKIDDWSDQKTLIYLPDGFNL